MKRTFLTLLALPLLMTAVAQSSKPAANAVLISQVRNGNTVTTRYLVPQKNNSHAGFDLHYVINRSDISPVYGDNAEQIVDLREFMQRTADTMMHIGAISVHGYASPDGNVEQNDSLAAKRASSLYHYAMNTYHPKTKISTSSRVFSWKECVPAVTESDIPSKQAVLQILNSAASEQQKQLELRKHPDVWHYLTAKILPQMRYANIEFDYGVDSLVTTTFVEQPKPAPAPAPAQTAPQEQPSIVFIDEETGVIVATPKERDERRAYRKEMREKRREARRNK